MNTNEHFNTLLKEECRILTHKGVEIRVLRDINISQMVMDSVPRLRPQLLHIARQEFNEIFVELTSAKLVH
jgi:hypothetical protein